MPLEGLRAFLRTDIPQFGFGITGTGQEAVVIPNGDRHNITGMVVENSLDFFGLDVPKNASGVTTGCDDLGVVFVEAAA